MKQLILASQSPRRKELLEKLGHPFLVCPAVGEEVMDDSLMPSALVESLAKQKAEEVAKKYPQDIVLGADTVVVVDGTVFGKPKSEAEAVEMVLRLQVRAHQVFTGVCLWSKEKTISFSEESQVILRPLSRKQVESYVARGESLDKAGGYGIQTVGAFFVEGIRGDFFNVMGLPLCALGKVLPEFSVPVFGEVEGEI